MLTPGERQTLETSMKVNNVIWAAMLASLGVYVILVNAMEPPESGTVDVGDSLPVITYALMAVSVIIAVLSRYIKKIMLGSPSKPSLLSGATGAGANKDMSMVAKYSSTLMVSLAMAESIGVFGLVLYFMGATRDVFYLFIAASALLIITYKPKMSELEDLVKRTKNI
ncbi:MAG: hypothetical protein JSV21_01110 [Nitrospirota bacterium]|nr:MAG: hypothetical protein JSV21_01110 [Nitrospirota bacterium]